VHLLYRVLRTIDASLIVGQCCDMQPSTYEGATTKLRWTIGVALVGALLASKKITFDPVGTGIGTLAGGVIGFLIGCIVVPTTDLWRRKRKILYWMFAVTVFGTSVGLGRGVPASTTATVIGCSVAVGLAIGLLQFFCEQRRTDPPNDLVI
jgi:ABC-type uncharacterized transport system permease subunit